MCVVYLVLLPKYVCGSGTASYGIEGIFVLLYIAAILFGVWPCAYCVVALLRRRRCEPVKEAYLPTIVYSLIILLLSRLTVLNPLYYKDENYLELHYGHLLTSVLFYCLVAFWGWMGIKKKLARIIFFAVLISGCVISASLEWNW